MSTDLARELDHRYRTRFANDDTAKTLNPPKVEGGADAALSRAELDELSRLERNAGRRTLDAREQERRVLLARRNLGQSGTPAWDVKPLAMPPAKDAVDKFEYDRDGAQWRIYKNGSAFGPPVESEEAARRVVDRLKRQATIAKDHAYVVSRIGPYTISEGAGVDAGWWFVKGRGESKKYKSRQDAEMHAEMSVGE